MRGGQELAVLEGVRRIFGGGTVAAMGADSLLGRFVARRDEAAFAAIVARHGPAVLGVCRRMLRDPHDVEDAFQATFLILIQKAASIRDAEGLGPWLHGVARKVAGRARAKASRRSATERSGLAIDPAGPASDPDLEEVRAAVDEEIGRLPERYRRAVVLCDLEGCSQPEAALRLDWTEGTVRGRLAKARGLLRSRLARRGLGVSAGTLAGLFAPDHASAARLAEATSKMVMQSATEAAGKVPTTVVALAREVMMGMFRQKVGSIALGAVVASFAFSGVGLVAARAQKPADVPKADAPPGKERRRDGGNNSEPGSRETPQPVATKEAPEVDESQIPLGHVSFPGLAEPISGDLLKNPPEPEPADTRRIAVGDLLIIEVLEALPGRAVTGERVVRPDGTVSLGFYGDLKVAGLTRREAKVKVVEHFRQWLTDQTLGLITYDEMLQKYVPCHPARSSRVYVDDSLIFDPRVRNRTRSTQPGPEKPGTSAKGEPSKVASNNPGAGERSSRIPQDRPTAGEKPGRVPPIRNEAGRPASPPASAPTLTIKAGDRLQIEVLEALPGRPVTGDRLVRPDGTVSLGFYGDLEVAGLTRAGAKAKVIEHLRQWLTDETLGLIDVDKDGTKVRVAPERSTRVFIDDDNEPVPRSVHEARLDEIDRKLDRVLDELDALRRDKGR